MSDAFTGEIRLLPYINARVPVNWMACHGQMLKITDYEPLYSILGARYGGDAVTTFALPNLNGRIAIGQGQAPGRTARTVGQTGGTETVTVTEAMVPPHTHAFIATTADSNQTVPGPTLVCGGDSTGADKRYLYPVPTPGPKFAALAADAVTSAGDDQPHKNIMPSICIQYCICVNGIYPTRA